MALGFEEVDEERLSLTLRAGLQTKKAPRRTLMNASLVSGVQGSEDLLLAPRPGVSHAIRSTIRSLSQEQGRFLLEVTVAIRMREHAGAPVP